MNELRNRPIRVFFPRFLTESHRTPHESARLVVQLARRGVHCWHEIPEGGLFDCVLTMSVFSVEDAALGYSKEPHNRPVFGYRQFARPVVHYCWDLYPWVVEDEGHPDRARWVHYLEELRRATEVWVPTPPVAWRVEQYAGRSAVVVPPVMSPWDADDVCVRNGETVVDVMRPYPGDPNTDAVSRACAELGLPCVKTGAGMPWDEYRKTIAEARLLVSAYREASTGSLALLDGYRLGKTVLLSDSEWNGGRHLFGSRARYFRWDDPTDLREKLKSAYHERPANGPGRIESRRAWADLTYGEAAFARRVEEGLRRVLGWN